MVACGGTDITKGDQKYPLANPQAKRTLQIRGLIDPSVTVRFSAYWDARNAKNSECGYLANWLEGVRNSYSVQIPIAPKIDDGHYELQVVTDEFLPGPCNWTFSGVLIHADGQVFDNMFSIDTSELIVANNPYLPRWRNMLLPTDRHLDVSCKVSKYTTADAPHEGTYMQCLDTRSGKKIRALLQENDSSPIELDIRSAN